MFRPGVRYPYRVSMPSASIHRLRVNRKIRRPREDRQPALPLNPRDPEVVRAKAARKRG